MEPADPAANEAALWIDRLSVSYGKFVAVQDLSLAVPPGSFSALIGNNGVGKTTTLHALLGLLPVRSGQCRVLGLDPVRQAKRIRQQVGFFPELDRPYDWMRVRDLLRCAEVEFPTWDANTAVMWMEQFELPVAKRVSELSKGMLAKLKLVVALAHNPQLLLLDEPTGGLDPGSRDMLMESVRQQALGGRCTVLWSTHLLEEVADLATHVFILHEKRCALALEMDRMLACYGILNVAAEAARPAELPLVVSRVEEGRRWVLVNDRDHPSCAAMGAETVEPATLRDVFRLITGGRMAWAHQAGRGNHVAG